MTTETLVVAVGRPVVAADSAETIGSVHGFVLDARGRSVKALHVKGRGNKAVVLDWSEVTAFGADAVIASSSDALRTVEDDHQKSAAAGAITMLGVRILTVDGRALGTALDAEFDTETGSILHVSTDAGPIEPERLRSLGCYALVVEPAHDPA